MKDKPIATIIAFSIAVFFMIMAIASVIIGGLSPFVDTESEDLHSTLGEIATIDEVVVTEQPPINTEVVTTVVDVEPTQVIIYDSTEHYNNYESYSDYEYDLVARTIYQEAGGCSEYCQWLVGSTVLNLADDRGGIENVVFDYNTFNVAYVLYDATPSDLSYAVAKRVLSGDRDYYVKAFRTDYYHSFGTPYTCVDNVYFSVY